MDYLKLPSNNNKSHGKYFLVIILSRISNCRSYKFLTIIKLNNPTIQLRRHSHKQQPIPKGQKEEDILWTF